VHRLAEADRELVGIESLMGKQLVVIHRRHLTSGEAAVTPMNDDEWVPYVRAQAQRAEPNVLQDQ
jgi:hypothetical protein